MCQPGFRQFQNRHLRLVQEFWCIFVINTSYNSDRIRVIILKRMSDLGSGLEGYLRCQLFTQYDHSRCTDTMKHYVSSAHISEIAINP